MIGSLVSTQSFDSCHVLLSDKAGPCNFTLEHHNLKVITWEAHRGTTVICDEKALAFAGPPGKCVYDAGKHG